jgi:hypothetical protein
MVVPRTLNRLAVGRDIATTTPVVRIPTRSAAIRPVGNGC